VQFLRFGESSLDFELLVWTRDPRNQQVLVSDLNFRIEESLRRSGLRVPFPQQDLHVRWPTLERVVEGWARKHLPDADREGAAGPEPLPLEGSEEDLAERGPEDWSDDEVRAWAERMRGPRGVPVEDRRWLLTVHRGCFVGSEAVDWLVRAAGLTRPEAIAVGGRMVGLGLVRHVLDEHGFHDGRFYYRFAEPPRVTLAAAAASERVGRTP
jgi:hypothetical protein